MGGSGSERCKMYKETQSFIKKLIGEGAKLDKNVYLNQIILIKNDLMSKDENVQKHSLEMLYFLLNLNIKEIDAEFVRMLQDNTTNQLLQTSILTSIKQKVIDTMLENKYNFVNIIEPWKNKNINKLTNVIEDVCDSDVPKEKCKAFFINTVIPTMMAPDTDNQIRDGLLDIAFVMSTILPISNLNKTELETFLNEVNTKYVINIGDLREKDYTNWHNLWIFLVRFCDKHIHYSMELTNKLLRVVEFAFRNSLIQQRLRGYDCWKELIDNASLDMNHMCSPKQIKLLITPLKAKFSKQEVVICKRFDVFTYLLEKLQHNAVLCLTEFLEFCFGSIDGKDASKTGQGKSVPQIWIKSAKVLIEIIGHSHNEFALCLTTEDVIKLEKPVINHTNISNFYRAIINSVAECCTLLREVDLESKRDTVIKCMWKSIFNLTLVTTDSDITKYFELISKILDNYLTQSSENPYCEELLTLIFTTLMSFDEEVICRGVEIILKQLLMILFTVKNFPANVANKFESTLKHLFSKICTVQQKLEVEKEIMSSIEKVKPSEGNIVYVGKIWLCLVSGLVADFSVEHLDNFNEFNEFFLWPAYNLHHLDAATRKQIILHWMKLYRKITTEHEEKKLHVMNDLQKIFQDNPLLNSNIVSLLNIMSQFETKFTKEFVDRLMFVTSLILQLPNLKTEEVQKISALVMQYFETTLECYKDGSNDEVIKNICTCIEHIFCIHKDYKLLDALTVFIKNLPQDLKSSFSKHLSPLFSDLLQKQIDASSSHGKKLQKALESLSGEGTKKDISISPFVLPSGRSARITRMAKNSPRSPPKKSKQVEASPVALRLFGKDLDTLSPLQVKGSQLKNVTPKSKKAEKNSKATKRSTPSIYDEKSSDFVSIDTEVKFQPEKLSKHQKEVLKKRREDIPALYQDLSQSLSSQDMFSSSSSSKGFETNVDTRKVIVEVIGDHGTTKTENIIELPPVQSPPNATEELKSDLDVSNTVLDVEPCAEIIKDHTVDHCNDDQNCCPEVVSEEVIPATDAVIVLNKDVAVKEDIISDADETMVEEKADKQIISEKNASESVSKDLAVKTENTPEPARQTEKVLEKHLVIVMETKKNEMFEVEERKRRELQKLKMNIVGAEEFLTASSKRRTREKSKKLEKELPKKSKTSHKQEKVSPPKPKTSRKSLSSTESVSKEPVSGKNRRRTIGAIEDSSSDMEPSKTILQDREPKKLTSPEARKVRRLSGKPKLDSSKLRYCLPDPSDSPESKNSKNTSKIDTNETPNIVKAEKRKRSSTEDDSEDIIESSQEFHNNITPVFNSSKKRIISEPNSTKIEEESLIQEVPDFSDAVLQIEKPLDVDLAPQNVSQEDVFIAVIAEQENTSVNPVEEVVNVQDETTPDTTVTQESSQDLTQIDEPTQESKTQQTEDTQTQQTETHDTLTQSELSQVSEDIRPPILYFDRPKKPVLTESEQMMCQMDTMSICIDSKDLQLKFQSVEKIVNEAEIRSMSPVHLQVQKLSMEMDDILSTPKSKVMNNLPSSPITADTPTRTSELLHDTLDISPISSKSSSDDCESETNNRIVPIKVKFDDDTDGIEEENVEFTEEKEVVQTYRDPEMINVKENKEIPLLLGDILMDLEQIPKNCEIILCQNEEIPIIDKPEDIPVKQSEEVLEIEETPYQATEEEQVKETSPKKPDMPDLEQAKLPKDNGLHERSSKLLNMVNVSSPMTHKMFIRKRGLTMSPSTARIKKLMSNFNQKSSFEGDIARDVKEEDLLTFSREVPSPLAVPRTSILKRKISDSSDSDGISPCPKRKRVNFSDPCLTSKKLFIKDDYHHDIDNFVFENISDLPLDEDQHPKSSETPDVHPNSEKQTETEHFETEPSLEIINPMTLKKDKPIYPKLVDCKENVITIFNRITSPMFYNTLMNKLNNKDIKTIGDLAKQTEVEINRFPFRVPAVANVYKALDSYYRKNVEKNTKEKMEEKTVEKMEAPKVNGGDENKRQCVIKKTSPRKRDFRAEFRQIIEKSKTEGTFEDLQKVILPFIEKQQHLNFFRHKYKISDLLTETDYKPLIKHITENIGLHNVLKILSRDPGMSEEISIYFDCVSKVSVEKSSPPDFWENCSLEDVRLKLEGSIKKKLFSKQNVLDQCLLPLIDSPKDISGYLNTIQVVDLGDIVVERLRGDDLTDFIRRVLDSCDDNIRKDISKDVVLRMKTPEEIVSVFQDCLSCQNEENRNRVMVEMFKYVSGNLSVHTLLELHVDFLKKVSSLMEK